MTILIEIGLGVWWLLTHVVVHKTLLLVREKELKRIQVIENGGKHIFFLYYGTSAEICTENRQWQWRTQLHYSLQF